jgi:DNA-binding NtrC family response regulator
MRDTSRDARKESGSPVLLFRRVLLVEDETRLREMLLRAIGEMGFECAGVSTGESALRQLAHQTFDTMIIDLNLPGIGGMDLLEQVHAQWPSVQAIILTGFGDLEAAKKAIRLDVVDFLTKPCSLAELETALGRASARRLQRADHDLLPRLPAPSDTSEPMLLEELERKHILATLQRHAGNRAETATELGISLRTLYYRLGEYQRQGLLD